MTPPNERSRPVKAAPADSTLTALKSPSTIAAAADKLSYVDHFRARVVQDALTEAMRSYWLRRAAAFEAARYRPGIDYPGLATIEEHRAKWRQLTEKAAACRAHATICLFDDTAAIAEHLKAAA